MTKSPNSDTFLVSNVALRTFGFVSDVALRISSSYRFLPGKSYRLAFPHKIAFKRYGNYDA